MDPPARCWASAWAWLSRANRDGPCLHVWRLALVFPAGVGMNRPPTRMPRSSHGRRFTTAAFAALRAGNPAAAVVLRLQCRGRPALRCWCSSREVW